MKYFAILWDSFREARDSKVLYVLFALSTIAIVLVGSLGFKPLGAKETFQHFTRPWDMAVLSNPTNNLNDPTRFLLWRRPQISLAEVDVVRGEPDSPLSEYKLTLNYQPPMNQGNAVHMDMDGAVVVQDTKVAPVPLPNKGTDVELAAERKKFIDDLRAQAREDVQDLFRKAEELDLIKVVSVDVGQAREGFLIGVPKEDWARQHDNLTVTATVKGTPRTNRVWASEVTWMFGAVDMSRSSMQGPLLFQTSDLVLYFGGMAAVMLGVIITASFIPNMLRKGTVDLLLVKPIRRWALMLYKYIGGLSFIFLVTAYSIFGMWLVIGLRSGIWSYQTLLLIPTITFFFAILYAISTFVGVMMRSTIACILLTIAVWFFCFLVGWFYQMNDLGKQIQKKLPAAQQRAEENGWSKAITAIHLVTPRTKDLDRVNALILYSSFVTGDLADLDRFNEAGAVWWESLLVSGVWIGFFVGLSCLWFSIKDY